MRSFLLFGVALVVGAACRDLNLPQAPPPPGPGSLQGTLLYAAPGRTMLEPAVGARVRLTNAPQTALANEDGYFRLEGLTLGDGAALFELDVDGDGAADRQKRLDLRALGAGFGKDIALGQLVLGRNASVAGVARRADVSGLSGHGGTMVFVPEGPFSAQTADDGSFVLEALPEGPLTLGFFRPGYENALEMTSLRAGERLALSPVQLQQRTTLEGPGTLSVRVLNEAAEGLAGATIRVGTQTLNETDLTGRTSGTVTPGVYVVHAEASGRPSLSIPNVMIASEVTTSLQLLLPLGVPIGGGSGAGGGGATGGGGGATGGGTSSDDGGASPIARIAPIAPHFNLLQQQYVTLDGSGSTGNGLLTYHWREVLADGGVVPGGGLTASLSDNDSATASLAQIGFHNGATTVTRAYLELEVSEVSGRRSAPVRVLVQAAMAPQVSQVAVPDSVVGGVSFVVTALGVDLNQPPIAVPQLRWTVAQGQAQLTPLADGRSASVVATSGPVVLRVRAVNAWGLEGPDEETAPIPVLATWSLTASASSRGQDTAVVAAGEPVQLSADAGLPGATYQWSPTQGPLDAGVPEWTLVGATTATPAFIAPAAPSARPLSFTVTATVPGATPATRTASVNVTVADLTPPTVVSTSLDGGYGSIFGVKVTFDEPVVVQNGDEVVVTAPNDTVVLSRVTALDPRTVVVTPATPWTPGAAYVLQINTRDLAGNAMPNTQLSFVAALHTAGPQISSDTSEVNPMPGLVLRKTPTSTSVVPFGRQQVGGTPRPWFLTALPVDGTSCSQASCALPTAFTTGHPLKPGAVVPFRRGHAWGDTPVALLEVAQPDAGATAAVLLTLDGNGMPVTLLGPGNQPYPFSGGVAATEGSLYSIANDGTGNVKLMEVKKPGFTLTTETIDFSGQLGASTTIAFAAQEPVLAVVATSPSVLLLATRGSSGWPTTAEVLPPHFLQTRLFPLPLLGPLSTPTFHVAGIYEEPLGQLTEPRFAWGTYFPTGNNHTLATGLLGGARVSDFDVVLTADLRVTAFVSDGLLRVTVWNDGGSLTLAGNGAVPQAWNTAVGCVAASPELLFIDRVLWMTWAEQCGAQPWRLVTQALR